MALPKVELKGSLIEDPVTREVKSGHMVTARIRTTRNRKDESGKWQVAEKLFLDLVAFSNFSVDDARRLAMSKKNDVVTVTGDLSDNSWTKRDGTKVTAYRVKVGSVAARDDVEAVIAAKEGTES